MYQYEGFEDLLVSRADDRSHFNKHITGGQCFPLSFVFMSTVVTSTNFMSEEQDEVCRQEQKFWKKCLDDGCCRLFFEQEKE